MDNISETGRKYHSHITSKHKRFEFNFREVWRYRDLIWLFTKKNFILTYKQTILGPAWILINPLLTSLMYTFVFGGIAGISTGGIPKLLFYLSGTAMWGMFSSSVNKNASTFTGNAGIFGKVYFPRLTVPFSNMLSSMIRFGVQFALVLIFLLYYVAQGAVHPVWWLWLVIPLILINLGIMGMGFGIIVSSLTTKYRDLSMLVGFGVSLWMYGTPVVYPLSQITDPLILTIVKLNPVTMPMELFRYAVLGVGTIEPGYYAISLVFTVAVFMLGTVIFNRVEKTFMDTV